jgi:hypothetical protein
MVYGPAKLLESIIRPDEGGMSPELARYLLTLDFTPEQHARYAVLAGKAQAGTLTDGEAAEIDEHERPDHGSSVEGAEVSHATPARRMITHGRGH